MCGGWVGFCPAFCSRISWETAGGCLSTCFPETLGKSVWYPGSWLKYYILETVLWHRLICYLCPPASHIQFSFLLMHVGMVQVLGTLLSSCETRWSSWLHLGQPQPFGCELEDGKPLFVTLPSNQYTKLQKENYPTVGKVVCHRGSGWQCWDCLICYAGIEQISKCLVSGGGV